MCINFSYVCRCVFVRYCFFSFSYMHTYWENRVHILIICGPIGVWPVGRSMARRGNREGAGGCRFSVWANIAGCCRVMNQENVGIDGLMSPANVHLEANYENIYENSGCNGMAAEVPVLVDDNGTQYDTQMIAGAR